MKNNFQKIPLIFSIVFLLSFCLSFYFLYKEIEKQNVSTEEITINWQKEAGRLEEISSLARGLKMVEKEIIELDKHFAKNSDVVPFLDTIEQLAPKVGAKAETTSVDLSSDKLGLLVGLSVKGKFDAVYKFFTLLENSPYELEIISFIISNKEQTSDWEAGIQIKLISFIN